MARPAYPTSDGSGHPRCQASGPRQAPRPLVAAARLPRTQEQRSAQARLNRGGWIRCGRAPETGLDPAAVGNRTYLSLIHISEPTRLGMISYAVFRLKKKKKKKI